MRGRLIPSGARLADAMRRRVVGLGIIAAATIGARRVKRSRLPHRAARPMT